MKRKNKEKTKQKQNVLQHIPTHNSGHWSHCPTKRGGALTMQVGPSRRICKRKATNGIWILVSKVNRHSAEQFFSQKPGQLRGIIQESHAHRPELWKKKKKKKNTHTKTIQYNGYCYSELLLINQNIFSFIIKQLLTLSHWIWCDIDQRIPILWYRSKNTNIVISITEYQYCDIDQRIPVLWYRSENTNIVISIREYQYCDIDQRIPVLWYRVREISTQHSIN